MSSLNRFIQFDFIAVKHFLKLIQIEFLISRIMKSVGSRKNFQQRMLTDSKKVFRIDELFNAMVTIKNITQSVDYG